MTSWSTIIHSGNSAYLRDEVEDLARAAPGQVGDEQIGDQRAVHGVVARVLEARQRVTRRVGVQGGERTVVTGVHRLEHVERLTGSTLADDDSVRAHAQAVLHEIANGDRALAFEVGGA